MGAHFLQQYTVITVAYGATWVLTHLLAALVILSVEGDYPLLQGVYDEARPKHESTGPPRWYHVVWASHSTI